MFAFLLLFFTTFTLHLPTYTHEPFTYISPYGTCCITEPVLIELIKSPSMQRLKNIAQYGISPYIKKQTPLYTRFDHSLGVLFLVRIHGGSLLEQIAALLHDVSHTVFSHVGDILFEYGNTTVSYQDAIHSEFIRKTGIVDILARYNITPEDINPQNGQFPLLEQPLPNLCADRIEYTLRGGLISKIFSEDDICFILKSLAYNSYYKHWYFTDLAAALLFAQTSLFLTNHVLGSAWNTFVYKYTAYALKRALDINLITIHDIQFGIDTEILNTVLASDDNQICHNLAIVHSAEKYFSITSSKEYATHIYIPKFRGIDPLVEKNGLYIPLSQLNQNFAKDYSAIKKKLRDGWWVIENVSEIKQKSD